MWQQLLELRKEHEQYRPDWKPIKFNDHCDVYYGDNGWLSDLIGKEQLLYARSKALFVIAQTGKGKTTMIFDNCLPIANEKGKKILYLCSRNALCHQIKTKAMEDEINKEMYAGDMFVKDFDVNLTEAGIRARTDFGLLTIMTYQHFVKNTRKIRPEDFCFVIADEAHFITSDSPFNVTTYMAFERMIKMFRDCTRIYLTATPDECIDCIYDLEKRPQGEKSLNIDNLKWKNSNPYFIPSVSIMDFYVMKEDYSYIIPHFFKNDEEMIDHISKNISQNWLLFVRNKNKGNALKENFECMGADTEFITAEIDKNNELYNSLLTKEQLPCSILISTKVLDVGINVQTSNLSVVVFEEDVVTLKQMIGRKRLKPGELLHVYFKTPTLDELSHHRNKIATTLEETKKARELVEYHHMLDTITPPFFFNGNQLDFNPCFFEKLNLDIFYYDNLIDEMEQEDCYDAQCLVYVKRMLEHFPGVQWNERSIFIIDNKASVEELLSGYLDRWFDKEELNTLSEKLLKIFPDPRERARDNPLNKININSLINPFNYQLVSEHNPVEYCIKRKGDNSNE